MKLGLGSGIVAVERKGQCENIMFGEKVKVMNRNST